MKKAFVYLILGVVLGGLMGFAISQYLTRNHSHDFVEVRNSQNYHYINPLLECEIGSNLSQSSSLARLKSDIEVYIDEKTQNEELSAISLYYRDLNNGPWIGINEKNNFSPASLLKLPIMISYYKHAELDPSILQQTIVNGERYDYSVQSVTPAATLAPDQSYTISELIERMIKYSDNASYFLLTGNLDDNFLIRTYVDLGITMTDDDLNSYENIITVKEYASFFRILYNSSYLDKKYSEEALRILSQTTYDKGLRASIPKKIPIAHKFGERYFESGEKQLHDCGIVYYPDKPYLLCVMTRGTDFDVLSAHIRDISQIVYNHVDETVKEN